MKFPNLRATREPILAVPGRPAQAQFASLHPGSDLEIWTLVAFSDTGSNTAPPDSNTAPLDSNTAPLGSNADPLGSNADPLGSNADPLGSNADPLGSNADPLGSNADPLGSNADPLGSNADPLGSNTATELVRSHSHCVQHWSACGVFQR
uniref:Uncharacterized protein n=1 Tax=Salvator merianae TaxID=96440 RepID=A0A8D0BP70_SALMN